MVWDWWVSRADPMPFCWPRCSLLFCLQLFSLSLLFLYRLVVWGWGPRTDRVSISLSRPCIAIFNNNNNNNKISVCWCHEETMLYIASCQQSKSYTIIWCIPIWLVRYWHGEDQDVLMLLRFRLLTGHELLIDYDHRILTFHSIWLVCFIKGFQHKYP